MDTSVDHVDEPDVAADLSSVNVNDPRFQTVRAPRLLADAFGISTSEARRKLQEGGVNVQSVTWQHLTGCVEDFDGLVLSLGKRRHVRCVLSKQ